MNNQFKLIAIVLCSLNLTACILGEESSNTVYTNYVYDDRQFYPQGYYQRNEYSSSYSSGQSVEVPESYHVGAYHSPVSSKDRDRSWVEGQNPQGYTIEVADEEKAAQVANKLYKAPKADRMAQVKYQRNGKPYYKGLYGTYDNAEAAQKALDSLPAEIKQGAGVKNWGSIQQNINE